jgi:hypothetical protein
MMTFMGIAVFAVFAFVLIGMIGHSLVFGSVVWLIAKRVSDASEQQRPKPCGYCGSILSPEAKVCGSCGAPRDPKHVVSSPISDPSIQDGMGKTS